MARGRGPQRRPSRIPGAPLAVEQAEHHRVLTLAGGEVALAQVSFAAEVQPFEQPEGGLVAGVDVGFESMEAESAGASLSTACRRRTRSSASVGSG